MTCSRITPEFGLQRIKICLKFIAVFFGFLLLANPLQAHHSRSAFDTASVITYEGIVREVAWRSPHVYISIDLEDGGEWHFESDSIPILIRTGWTDRSVVVGEHIVVEGNPGRKPSERASLLVSVLKDDGTVLTPRSHFQKDSRELQARSGARSLAGVWELPYGDYGDYFVSWGVVELTEAGASAQALFTPSALPTGTCIGTPTPMLLAMPYLSEIELQEDIAYIRSEFFNTERIIYLDGRGHPENGVRTNQGHSIGRWEGEDLIIDTRLFEDHPAPMRSTNEGVPSGAHKHVIERFSLSDDGSRVKIEVFLEDPEFLATPFQATLEWAYVADFELSNYSCVP
jgi:hypothetical protein